MDGQRFDAMARALVGRGSRRVARRSLAAGVGAAGLSRFRFEEVAAACKAVNKKCDRSKECCHQLCKGGRCRCKQLRQRCRASANCCDSLSTACNSNEKPQCNQEGFRCLRLLNANCVDACDCAVGMVCSGSPVGSCCFPAGAPCGVDDTVCCSLKCTALACE